MSQKLTLRLQELKSEVTKLGHEHIQKQLPIELGEAIKQMEAWGNVEAAFDKLITKIK